MRIGIVGAGSMGRAHAAGWAAAGAEVVGVAAAHRSHAEELARAHGARAYEELDALLEDVEVVDLCVPTDLHHPMTLRAAAAGRHVVVEKPMALSTQDGEAMIAACEAAGVRLFVAMVVRFFPQYRAAAEALAAGAIGDLGVLRLRRVSYPPKGDGDWFRDEARSGGLLLDLMVHDLDVARWWGGPVTRVHARSRRGLEPGAPGDYALLTLRLASGALALIEGGWAYPPGVFRTAFDAAGTDGLIEWDSDASEPLRSFLAPDGAGAARVGLPLTVFAESPYTTQLRHVLGALRSGAPFAVTAEDGLEAVRLALAARASLASGRPVEVAP